MNPNDVPKVPLNHLALYFFENCPYCHRVMSVMKRLKLSIELRNIHEEEKYFRELVEEGGMRTVPCLKITLPNDSVHWMYESLDIAAYLEKHYS